MKGMEMSLFQEEFVRRGLRLVHDVPNQVNPAVDTRIGYTAVLGAEVFTEMEGMVEEVSHLGFPVRECLTDGFFSKINRTRRSSS